MSGTDIVPKPAASEGSFVMPAGRRLSRVDSKTLRQSFNAQNQAVSTDEVEQILRNLDRKDNKIKYNRRMRMALIGAIGFLALMVGAMFVVTFAANEASKEMHAKDGALTNKAGTQALAVDNVKSYGNILGFPCLPMDILQNMDEVALEVQVSKAASSDGLMDVVLKVGTVNRFEEDKRVDVKSPSNQQQLSVAHGMATYKDEDNCKDGCKVIVSLDVATGRRLTRHAGAVDRSLTASPPRALGSFATYRQMAKVFKQACEAFKSVGAMCDAMGIKSDATPEEVTQESSDIMAFCKELKDVSLDERIECNKETKALFTPKEILSAENVQKAYEAVSVRCTGEKSGRMLKGGRRLAVDIGWCSANLGFVVGLSADSSNYCDPSQRCDSWNGCGSSVSSCCITHDKCLQSPSPGRSYSLPNSRCAKADCKGKTCDNNLRNCAWNVNCRYKWKCGWWKCWGYDVGCGLQKTVIAGAMSIVPNKNFNAGSSNSKCS